MAKEYPEMNVLKYYHAMGPEAYKELLSDVVIRVGGYYLGQIVDDTVWCKVTKIVSLSGTTEIHFSYGKNKWLSWFWPGWSPESPMTFLLRLNRSNPNTQYPKIAKLKELDLSKPNA